MMTATLLLLLCAGMACIQAGQANYINRPGKYASLGTFYAAMLPIVPEIEERAQHLSELIRYSDLDVICLQGMWRTDLQRRLYEDLNDLYPYSHSLINLTSPQPSKNTPACTPAEVMMFESCLNITCSDDITDVECHAKNCLHLMLRFSYECRYCLILNFFPFNAANCLTHPASAYERSFGLMLLSKKETSEVQVNGYLGKVSDMRGYIKSYVANVGDVFCTELSYTLDPQGGYIGPPLTIPFKFQSYPQQQFQEVKHLLQLASATENTILMGNFNHGPTVATPPDVSDIFYYYPLHYGLVNAHGYFSPYILWDGRCTLCQENEVVLTPSKTVDHIYLPVTSSQRVLGAERIWDNEFTTLSMTPLSNHYGVKVLIREMMPCDAEWWFCEDRKRGNQFPKALPNIDKILAAITPEK